MLMLLLVSVLFIICGILLFIKNRRLKIIGMAIGLLGFWLLLAIYLITTFEKNVA